MPPQQPHIVLITTDQLRADALGCYGGRAVQTPHLDRLAASGTRFDRAYTVSPWCLPSRSSIVTGRFPHHHRAYSNFRDGRLDPALPNLYNTLGANGYTTAHVGKCHYAPVPYGETLADRSLPYEAFRRYYLSLGIDQLVLQDGKQNSVWFTDDYNQELDRAGYLHAYRDAVWNRANHKVFPFPGPAAWHPDSWTGRQGAALVDAHNGERPLFLWLSLSGPHFPFDAPNDYLARVDARKVEDVSAVDGEFDDPRRIHHTSFHGPRGIEGAGAAGGGGTQSYSADYWRELRTRYYANVALLDDQVGRVLDAVERRLGENVLVIFTTDHGEMLGNHRLWGKHNCAYEDVLRVPLLVRYPGPPAPAQTTARVMLTDLFPTCLVAAGITGVPSDGVALPANVARGGYQYTFAEGEHFLAVTDGATKYVQVRRGDEWLRELFDLSTDLPEVHNVIADPALAPKLIELQGAIVDRFMDDFLTGERPLPGAKA